jgi:hypothetical protein
MLYGRRGRRRRRRKRKAVAKALAEIAAAAAAGAGVVNGVNLQFMAWLLSYNKPGRGHSLFCSEQGPAGVKELLAKVLLKKHADIAFEKTCNLPPHVFNDMITKNDGELLYLINFPVDPNGSRGACDSPQQQVSLHRRRNPPILTPEARFFNWLLMMKRGGSMEGREDKLGASRATCSTEFRWILRCFMQVGTQQQQQ